MSRIPLTHVCLLLGAVVILSLAVGSARMSSGGPGLLALPVEREGGGSLTGPPIPPPTPRPAHSGILDEGSAVPANPVTSDPAAAASAADTASSSDAGAAQPDQQVQSADTTRQSDAEASSSDPPPAAPDPAPVKDSLVVSMWGSPTGLGVLGQVTPDAAMAQLQGLSDQYRQLDGGKPVTPAFFVVYAVAQDEPTDNGLYLRYLKDEEVWPYLTLAHQNHGLVFLDLQMGLSDVRTQLDRLRPYLLDPSVHIALDPEYAVHPGQQPGGLDAGSLDAADLNTAQAYLEQLVEENHLPDKILVIHQFQDNVITNGDQVQRFAHVSTVVNMDAYGDALQKIEKYEHFAQRPYAEYASFNLFLHLDNGLMPAQDVMKLSPRPSMVIYQ